MEIGRSSLNLTEVHLGGDYDSAFENDSEAEKSRKRRIDLATTSAPKPTKRASKEFFREEWSKEEGRKQRYHLLSLDAYSRHKKLVNEYFLCYPGTTSLLQRDRSKDKTETDILKENHKFLWDDGDIAQTCYQEKRRQEKDGKKKIVKEQRLAKKYYDKLFKEYCIADLHRYKENKVAMRWQTESELLIGKGQFICGNKECSQKEGLRSWEVNFAYSEQGIKKNALIKLRLCPDCSCKLNYHHKRNEVKPVKKQSNSESDDINRKNQKPFPETETTFPLEVDQSRKTGDIVNEKGQAEIWKEPVKILEDKSQEEEFEDYLSEMLL